jgi:anti-sigma factor RsiW
MAACEERLVALMDLVSGEQPEAERRDIESHVASCAACRAELAELRQTEDLLQSTARRPDDFQLSGFAFRVADRAEAFRDRSPRGLWWSLTRSMRVTLAASSVAVAASLSLFVLSRQPAPLAVNLPNAPARVSEEAASGVPDMVQLVAEDGDMPDVSLDSALDALSPDELDTLTQKLSASSG